MTRVAATIVALVVPALIVASVPAFSADFFVANSTAPGLKTGDIIDGDEPLSLVANTRVTVIDERGNTLTLNGPYNGHLGGGADGGTELFDALEELVNPDDQDIQAVGGIASLESDSGRFVLQVTNARKSYDDDATGSSRTTGEFSWGDQNSSISAAAAYEGADVSVSDPNANLGHTGSDRESALAPDDPFDVILRSPDDHHCVPTGMPVVLWRPSSHTSGSLTLRLKEKVLEAEVFWPAGAARMSWPADLAVAEDQPYRVAFRDEEWTLVLHFIPVDLPNQVHRIAWMAEKGCTKQALALLNKLD